VTTDREWFEHELVRYEDDFKFRLEYQAMDFTEQICRLMKDKDLTRAKIAERLNKSKSYVSRILNNVDINLTLRTLLQFVEAAEGTLKIRVEPRVAEDQAPVRPQSVEVRNWDQIMLGIGGPLPVVRRLVVEPLAADSGEQDEYRAAPRQLTHADQLAA